MGILFSWVFFLPKAYTGLLDVTCLWQPFLWYISTVTKTVNFEIILEPQKANHPHHKLFREDSKVTLSLAELMDRKWKLLLPTSHLSPHTWRFFLQQIFEKQSTNSSFSLYILFLSTKILDNPKRTSKKHTAQSVREIGFTGHPKENFKY